MNMWKIKIENGMILNASPTLEDAMKFAKGYGKFVTITNDEMEFVGKFGVDTIKDGKCPDGVDYTWMKRRNM
jgi:hypothetical protein